MATTAPDENEFVNRFLTAEQPIVKVGDKEWQSDLIEDFCVILRGKLQNTGVKWVNPVVQLVLLHPERIWGQKDVQWHDDILESLYRPVAVAADVQEALNSAYEVINYPGTPKEKHLTPKLRPHIVSPNCYRCTWDNGNNTITMYPCDSCDPVEILESVSHYSLLFEISNPVWFLPSPVLSLQAAMSELNQEYLVGTYMGLESTPSSCACKRFTKCYELHEALEWAIRLFYVRRLKDQNNQLVAVLRQNQKQMQMLRLLRVPLDRLSDALVKAQKDVQELRAVMYSPTRGLFAAARSVWPYFEEHKIVHAGGVSWQVEHKVASYKKPFAVAATIAAIVCAVFGRGIEEVQSGAVLYERMIELLRTGSPGFEGLRRLCWVVLTHGNPDDDEKKEQVSKWLADILRLKDEVAPSALNDLKGVLDYFKDVLFTPYKIDDLSDKSLLPLWLVLFGNKDKPDIKITDKTSNSDWTASTWMEVFDKNNHLQTAAWLKIPLPQYSLLLEFLSGVVEGAGTGEESSSGTPEKATVVITYEAWALLVTFGDPVFNREGVENLWTAVCGGKANYGASSGNFRKPFLEFTRRVAKAHSREAGRRQAESHNNEGESSAGGLNGNATVVTAPRKKVYWRLDDSQGVTYAAGPVTVSLRACSTDLSIEVKRTAESTSEVEGGKRVSNVL